MRLFLAVLTLVFLISLSFTQANDTTEGGNISVGNISLVAPTSLWAGIVGWMNGSVANTTTFISTQLVNYSDIYTNEPNGNYAVLSGYSMIVTRLPFMPLVGTFTTPVKADFEDGGMFENFTVFTPINSSMLIDGPDRTFCNPACSYTNFNFYAVPYSAAYITLNQNTVMGVLKFSNGTHEEPLFICSIASLQGYNGTFFDFEYMVPAFEEYYFYVYTTPIPPYVEIITPEPITYDTGLIPFTYIMYDDTGIDSCWYILDGVRVDMPVCGPSYILDVDVGTHTLYLYANDTTGNVSSDSVTFQVSIVPPPPPVPPSGGPPGTPYWPRVPPPPPGLFFSVMPENIYVTIDYPDEGVGEFSLYSSVALQDVSCYVVSDFAEYTTVEITDVIPANGTIKGRVIVDMPPTTILEYDGDTKGYMQCVGEVSPTLIASTIANVYLTLNLPAFESEDEFIEVMVGEEKEGVIPFFFVGEGNSSAINISVEFTGAYSPLLSFYNITHSLEKDEMGLIYFKVTIPDDMEPGIYKVPFTIYENGLPFAYGILTIEVKQPPVYICTFVDVLWTLLILLIGLIISVYVFRRKLDENINQIGLKERRENGWMLYRKPLAYAAITMLVFMIIWFMVITMFFKCI